MFSGIIEELGQVKRISRSHNFSSLEIRALKTLVDINAGDSVAVNGVCLTLVKKGQDWFSFEVMPETLKSTNLSLLRVGDKVNLERALQIGQRLSGHFVSGHIDCLGLIRKKYITAGNQCFEISFPVEFRNNCYKRGSIAVDGISLTVMNKKSSSVDVYIIPHTLKNTTLSFKGPSDKVNIEFDLLLKKAPV